MTAALITGATGWLGRQFVEAIVNGLPDVPGFPAQPQREIRVLVQAGTDAAVSRPFPANVTAVQGDLTDPRSLERFTQDAAGATLFHTAGLIHPVKGVRQLYDVNATGTRNLLAAAVDARVRRFVHVSSNSVAGLNASAGEVFDEHSTERPYMNYGKSKRLAEDHVNAACRDGRIEAVILRPPWFYGPGQPERQSRFIRMVRDGKVPIVGSGENRRSMAYVDNICQAMLLCERVASASGRTYWIADERPYTMNEIVDTIAASLSQDFGITVSSRRLRLPSILSEMAVMADGLLQSAGLYITEVHVLGEMNKTIACSAAKAERELGYRPAITLREGMRRSIQWMLDRGIAI